MKTEQLYEAYKQHPVISTDTRQITSSCLFFALRGENFNANEFAAKALDEGASFAIIDEAPYVLNDRYILVDNVLESLQHLAQFHRRQLQIPVIGITGTNGKTTTKELIRTILSQHFKCFATAGNLNNHIGVPLSLLSIKEDYNIAIIEMGANHQKEIEFLCSLARPTHGLITNVGKAHLEGFGGYEGVRIAKGELYDYLGKTGGTVFINGDNDILMEMCMEKHLKNIVSYGRKRNGYLTADPEETFPLLSVKWNLNDDSRKSYIADSNLPGTYNFENIAAAICIGNFFGLSPEEINAGIAAYKPENSRSQILNTEKNTIICDYYNANPSSMAVALDNFASVGAENKVMILGDMFELGTEATSEHQQLIKKALKIPSNKIIFVGDEFYNLKRNIAADFYKTTEEAFQALEKKPIRDSMILLKGSRGMKFEKLLPLL